MVRVSEAERASDSAAARAKYFDEGAPGGLGLPADVLRSWARCSSAGLESRRPVSFNTVERSRIAAAAERSRALLAAAAAEVQRLGAAVGDAGLIVLLTDDHGTVIDVAGDLRGVSPRLRLAARKGVDMRESVVGTNAVGTSLIERAGVSVVADEHYFAANAGHTCVAMPVFDPSGKLIGVLDVSGDLRAARPNCAPFVQAAARSIENRLIRQMPEAVFVEFAFHPDALGTTLQAIVAFDPSGRVIAANERARSLLCLDLGDRRIDFSDIFSETTFTRLLCRAGSAAPQALRSHAGLRFPVRVARSPAPAPSLGGASPRGPSGRPRVPLAVDPDPVLELLEAARQDVRTAAEFERARRGLAKRLPLLITGETGTGKELFARGLHRLCGDGRQPFVALNCASLPEALIEAELFGYVDGAFTGARRGGNVGKIELAEDGLLFLDEIGDMPPLFQAKLLRVLQDRVITRLGENRERPVRFTLVCATHRALADLIERGAFREDLYYRIKGLEVCIPPLRERTNVLELADHFLSRLESPTVLRFSPSARALLSAHRWPGNLRQLGYAVTAAAAAAEDKTVIDAEDFPAEFNAPADAPVRRPAQLNADARAGGSLGAAVEQLIDTTVRECGGNVSEAARLLNVSRSTIYSRWKRRG